MVLLVEPDAACGRALAEALRQGGDHVRVVKTAGQALLAAGRDAYDLAVVDLLLRGGGVELARKLSRRIPRLYLSVGARLMSEEILETALGFPVLRKSQLREMFGRPRSRRAVRKSEAPPASARALKARAS
jgi:CheY-like chemotaxis protein